MNIGSGFMKKITKKVKPTEYEKISEAVERLENYKHPIHSPEWCSNRICWAWKFRKITREQMEELANRMTEYFKQDAELYRRS